MKSKTVLVFNNGKLCLSPICSNLPFAMVETRLLDPRDVVTAENHECFARSIFVYQTQCARVVCAQQIYDLATRKI